jgi:type I restriction enzyme, S subunit
MRMSNNASMDQEPKSELTPKLRFPEFQDTPGWDSKTMGEVYSFKGNNSLSREKLNYERGTVKNIHYGDIHTKFSTLFDITKEVVPYINQSESLAGFKAENYCVEGDMIFADASEDLEDIGKSIEVIKLNGERVLSGLHTILSRQTEARLAPGFAGHLFKSKQVRIQIQKESQGAKVFGLSGGRLAKIVIPFPVDKIEQQKIAECLITVDEVIAAQSQKLDVLKTHKKWLMQELFPREGETLPHLRFPEFQDAPVWEEKSLKTICKIQRGKFSHRPRNDPRFFGGKYPFIQTGDVVKSNGGAVQASQTLNELGLSVSKLFKPTIVLITIAANIGDTGLLEQEACFTDSVVGLIPVKGVSPYFLGLAVSGKKEYLNKIAPAAAQKNINNEILSVLPILIPQFEEQQRIASCLSSLDDLIIAQSAKLEGLRAHKKGLLQQLFPSPEEVET